MQAHVPAQLGRIAQTAIDTTLTGCFLVVWLLCWPFYRLYRSHGLHQVWVNGQLAGDGNGHGAPPAGRLIRDGGTSAGPAPR